MENVHFLMEAVASVIFLTCFFLFLALLKLALFNFGKMGGGWSKWNGLVQDSSK